MKKVTVTLQIKATMWAADWNPQEMIQYLKAYHDGQHPAGWVRDGIADQGSDITVTDTKIEEVEQ